MKRVLFGLGIILCCSLGAAAQADSTFQPLSRMHQGLHRHRMQRGAMAARLDLTDAQKQEARKINDAYHSQVAALEKDDQITLKSYHERKAALEQDRRSRMEALLTPEQKSRIAEHKKAMAQRMKMASDRRMDRMRTDLGLSDDQVAKISQQRKDLMEQAAAIRQNPSLTQEEKKEQFMTLRRSFRDNLSSILTPEQLKKRAALRNDHMNDWKNRRDNKAS